ncbi:hypothetical protein KDA14_02605 [Candidatus Saccharibacteria bacterium]|nr:hypothetical protein [Candidatus Saccharibacteria bacterium]
MQPERSHIMPSAKKQSISEKVMHDISSGTVAMHPRTYFTLLSALVAAVVVTAGLVTAYFTSILYFWVRIATADTMAYGARSRLSDALAAFPWWLLALTILLGVAAVWLVRRQGRLYKHRASTIALLLVAGSLLLGVVFASFDIGQPFAEHHAPMSNQHGQGGQRHTLQ